MSLSRSLVAALALSLVACGGATPSGDAATGNDSSTTQDSSSMMNTDSSMMMTTDASADGGGSGGGMCGQTAIDCVCRCGMNAACQNQCINANRACGQCVGQAQLSCCPAEATAIEQCRVAAQMPSDAGPACMDQACLAQRCAAQVMAFQTCFATAQQNNMACRTALGGCFGSFPITCPMM
jgi:hypothetical protein